MASLSFCSSVLVYVWVISSVRTLIKGSPVSDADFSSWIIEEDLCRTPDRLTGICISVRSCRTFWNLLDNIPQPITPELRKFLFSYSCSSDKKNPKVCCPSKPIDISQYIQITTKKISIVEQNTIPEPPDVSGHKNFYLLPEDCGSVDTGNRIIRGNKTGLYEFPWMALLSYRTSNGPKFQCGATIINERYLLTAAHCIKNKENSLLGVRIGEHNINTRIDCEQTQYEGYICAPPYQDLAIEKIIPHPEYDTSIHINDIGLLRTAFPMNITLRNMKPICLPVDRARMYNFTNKKVIISGWGATETTGSSSLLLKAVLPVMPLNECKEKYKTTRPPMPLKYTQMCTGGNTKSDACSGDSGGPLQVADILFDDDRMVQHGVISFGLKNCGKNGFPGVYTRVVYYMNWILDNMKP